MSKSGQMGMRLHQALSFSPPLVRIPRAEAVFWPGCALLMLDGALLERTKKVLCRVEPEIRLAAACCGQPSAFLFPGQAARWREKLAAELREQGVRRIYTACPNCAVQLRELGVAEVLPLWPVLAQCVKREDLTPEEGKFVWHDPCPTRKDPEQQKAVRDLLELAACDWQEAVRFGQGTACCGNFHMMRAVDPDRSASMRRRRLEDFPEERVILSSCEGCLDAFRSEGRPTCHLLELLFGRSSGRSWFHRIRTTLGIRRK